MVARVHDRRQTRLQRLRNIFFIDLLRFTGARPCELLDIQMKDIALEGNTYKLVIRGKKQKGRNRYYHLPSHLRDSYESYVHHRSLSRQNETALFISTSKQGNWTQKGMRGLFRALSKELGFKVIAYGFRRYVATTLNTRGLSMKDIGHFLGHSRASTTERYIERSCALTDMGTNIMGNDSLHQP
ncbi:site-specific integrase [Candidatus Peregrinibacteria bacterium]|nr:site-specific integrase [Candidatus Peregrinibacteria bacterium]